MYKSRRSSEEWPATPQLCIYCEVIRFNIPDLHISIIHFHPITPHCANSQFQPADIAQWQRADLASIFTLSLWFLGLPCLIPLATELACMISICVYQTKTIGFDMRQTCTDLGWDNVHPSCNPYTHYINGNTKNQWLPNKTWSQVGRTLPPSPIPKGSSFYQCSMFGYEGIWTHQNSSEQLF